MVSLFELGFRVGVQVNFSEWLNKSWKLTDYNLVFPLQSIKHGKLGHWLEQLDRISKVVPSAMSFDDVVSIGSRKDTDDHDAISDAIAALIPWRKGPFDLFEHTIDAEWRSDLKWSRLVNHVELQDREILDIGCGNGYYTYRMLQAGARCVVGLESFVPYVLQAALLRFFSDTPNPVVPLRFDPLALQHRFSVVFSMGVLYHQRNPLQHLADIAKVCEPGGTLILESLYADNDLVPSDRYARMRNVYLVPSIATLYSMLQEVGFESIEILDTSVTDVREQRRTTLMPFDSLAEALSTENPSYTIEKYPRPQRILMKALRT